jgi:hypothetical protein
LWDEITGLAKLQKIRYTTILSRHLLTQPFEKRGILLIAMLWLELWYLRRFVSGTGDQKSSSSAIAPGAATNSPCQSAAIIRRTAVSTREEQHSLAHGMSPIATRAVRP